ncbi:MAG: hypothetical protein E5V78_12945 [Mesorhizobium sp.]|nr:MAG: hypothetical protein E5V78_12945 [Mesorhizobium sp.]
MIPRYSRPEMVAIWSPETRFRIWFEIEAHACDALAELGVIPKEAARTIWEKGGAAKFDVAKIDEIERVTKHDVIAFLTHLAEFVGPDARFIHQGMTSSDVLEDIATCAISGAVGTFANIEPYVEEHVAAKLGLKPEPVSTQVIPRDRHAMFFATLGVIASSVERLAVEIRHLQRTEVLEAEEYFSPGQKGSSAMPHKRNPVLTENLTGLARMVRSMALPAMEDVALWHERDISHSSVERMIGPDATVTLDFALARLTGVVDKLLVYPENMEKNLNKFRGLVHSQRVLLALTQAGLSREDAYRLVQRNAMKVWEHGADFLEELLADKDVTAALSEGEIREKFDLGYHTKHVDTIFKRVFGEA